MAAQGHFFSHDFNARNNLKIIELRMAHGWKGYGLFWAMLEVMADADAKLDKGKLNLVSYQLQIDSKELLEFIASCLQIGLFQEDEDFLTCSALDERLEHKRKSVEKAKKAAAARWPSKENAQALLKHEPSNAQVMQTKLNETKLNETKDKEEAEASPPPKKKKSSKKLNPADRLKEFKDSVRDAGAETYSVDMLQAFYDYWTEPVQGKDKFRWELEKTWGTSRRLSTWAKRAVGFSETPFKAQLTLQGPSEADKRKEQRISTIEFLLSKPDYAKGQRENIEDLQEELARLKGE